MKFQAENSALLDIKSRLILAENEAEELLERLPSDSAEAFKAALQGTFRAPEFEAAPAYEQCQFRAIASRIGELERRLERLSKPRI